MEQIKIFLDTNKEMIIRYYLRDGSFIRHINEIYRKEFKLKK